MAIFGTPTVIGTLTSATSQTQYTVPITASTGQGDSFVVIAGSNGGGVNGIPSSITDGTGLINFQMYQSTPGVGQLTYWQVFNVRAFTNTDTILVNYPTANTNLKNIIVLDCPGVAPSPLALDQASIALNNSTVSGNNSVITVNSNLSYNYELVIFATQDSNTGGSPTGFGSFTVPANGIQHSGSGEFTAVSYQIVNGGVGPLTASCTLGAVSTYSGLTVGMVSSIPFYNVQFPFPPSVFTFNPALSSMRPQHSQIPVQTVVSSAPVSIIGAQSNTIVNGINFFTGNNTNFISSQGNWTNGGGTTIAQVGSPSHNAAGALQLTATGAGSINALSSTAGKITTAGLACNPGDIIFVAGWFLASTTGRTCIAGVSFLDVNAGTGPGTVNTTSVVDNTTTWVLGIGEVTAPANAAWARANMQVSSVANTEQHLISDVWLFNVTSGSGMGEQIQIFTPANQQFQLMPRGIPYPLSLNPALQFLPNQVATGLPSAFQPGVPGTASVSAPSGTPAVFQTFVPQFPWQPILPYSLQFNSSLSWLRPQYSTVNPTTFIDGGAGGQVAVNATFPDMNVSILLSASGNVSVAAPSPPLLATGVTANVNVVAQNGTLSETIIGSVSTINVAAINGSVSSTTIGAVANVSAQARAGTPTVTPTATVSANVSVTMAGDNVTVVTLGTTGNVTVASTASPNVSPQGVPASVNAAAVAGSMSVTITGVAANVIAASTEGVTVTLTGTATNVSVTAFPGQTGKSAGPGIGTVAVVAVAGVVSTTSNVVSIAAQITVAAIPGSVSRSLTGTTAKVTVVSNPGQDGTITITGFLVNPDLAEDILISDSGKLLSIPVKNMLVSATQSPQPQGI